MREFLTCDAVAIMFVGMTAFIHTWQEDAWVPGFSLQYIARSGQPTNLFAELTRSPYTNKPNETLDGEPFDDVRLASL